MENNAFSLNEADYEIGLVGAFACQQQFELISHIELTLKVYLVSGSAEASQESQE